MRTKFNKYIACLGLINLGCISCLLSNSRPSPEISVFVLVTNFTPRSQFLGCRDWKMRCLSFRISGSLGRRCDPYRHPKPPADRSSGQQSHPCQISRGSTCCLEPWSYTSSILHLWNCQRITTIRILSRHHALSAQALTYLRSRCQNLWIWLVKNRHGLTQISFHWTNNSSGLSSSLNPRKS